METKPDWVCRSKGFDRSTSVRRPGLHLSPILQGKGPVPAEIQPLRQLSTGWHPMLKGQPVPGSLLTQAGSTRGCAPADRGPGGEILVGTASDSRDVTVSFRDLFTDQVGPELGLAIHAGSALWNNNRSWAKQSSCPKQIVVKLSKHLFCPCGHCRQPSLVSSAFRVRQQHMNSPKKRDANCHDEREFFFDSCRQQGAASASDGQQPGAHRGDPEHRRDAARGGGPR